MRVLICTSKSPFLSGGNEVLVGALRRELARRGVEVEVVSLPFVWYRRSEILPGYLAWRMVSLDRIGGQKVDRIIATRVPSFVVSHQNKVTWLVHQLRTVYDLRGTEFSPFDHGPSDQQLMETIQSIDTKTLSESKRLFSISDNVGQRLFKYNGLRAGTLYPPPKHDGRYYTEGYGDYVLVVSRLNRLKRVDQIVRAMPYSASGVKLYVVGRGPEGENLERLVERKGVVGKVRFLGFVSDQELLRLYAGALAVFYAPYDEDYGFVTIEAFRSRKPMLSTSDAGGVLELIADGQNGYVLPPHQPQVLAAHIDRLYGDRALCRRMGEAGYESVSAITWERTVERLLS